MGSQQSTVDFILDQMGAAGAVSARKMFGEYGIYLDEKMVALVCDDVLFIKPTRGGKAHVGTPLEAPPYPGAKPCFQIAGDLCEDRDWLSELVRITAHELPLPKPKNKKAL
jgi:TfoX/Sxy family transcriptional regulator of competence genes